MKVSPSKSSTKEETTQELDALDKATPAEIESGVEMVEEMIFVHAPLTPEELPIVQSAPRPLTPPPSPATVWLVQFLEVLRELIQKEFFLFAVLATVVSLVLKLSSFWHGAFGSAFLMLVYKNLCESLKASPLIHRRFIAAPAGVTQQSQVIEHKSIKTYSGWMNQIDAYNPECYHVSDTQSVFVSVEGSVLRLASSKAKISKRHLWNDKTRTRMALVSEKLFELRGASVELWPRGLARKRYYSRKYPIKITLVDNAKLNVDDEMELPPPPPQKFRDSFDDESDTDKTDSQVSIKTLDLDTTITDNNTDLEFRDCEEDNREVIFLFARCDREKEDWLRRLVAASRGDIYDCNDQPLYKTSNNDSKSTTPSGSPVKSLSDDSINRKRSTNSAEDDEFINIDPADFSTFDHVVSPCASRTSSDFVNFIMAYVVSVTRY